MSKYEESFEDELDRLLTEARFKSELGELEDKFRPMKRWSLAVEVGVFAIGASACWEAVNLITPHLPYVSV